MKKIGGNIRAIIQIKETKRNDLGETVTEFKYFKTITGYLDYISGESTFAVYNTKLQDTTHIFICDYEDLPEENEIRFLINDKPYEIKLIDIPMRIKHHMEIYLRYVGKWFNEYNSWTKRLYR